MTNDNLQTMIEKYKHELMNLHKTAPEYDYPDDEAEQETVKEETMPETFNEERIPMAVNEDVIPVIAMANNESNTVVPDVSLPDDIDREELPTRAEDESANTEGFPVVPNIMPRPYDVKTREYNDISDFESKNPKIGFLKVQVFAADRAFPLSNATVRVVKNINGKTHVFYEMLTNSDGIVEKLPLPAPDREMSESPSSEAPYATYDVIVEHPAFERSISRSTQIFDGVESIQPVRLIPLVDINSLNVERGNVNIE